MRFLIAQYMCRHKAGAIACALEVLLVAAAAGAAYGVSPTSDEMWEKRKWVAATLEGDAEVQMPQAHLIVVRNNDAVQKNARNGGALSLSGLKARRGLFCHANSEVVVRLPGPGESFDATAGVDSNEQTSGGRGSAVFRVDVAGETAFRSPVMREGDEPQKVAVDLDGEREFRLHVDDAGDGIACDQADWANARATLRDGSVLWLGDMAMEEPQRPAYRTELPFSLTYDGTPLREMIDGWAVARSKREIGEQRIEHTVTVRDPESGLNVKCLAIEYSDFPVVEWTLEIENTGEAETPILEDILPLDTVFRRYDWPPTESTEFLLHHFTGSPCTAGDYGPQATRLEPETTKQISAAGGRPTNSDLCFFNVEWPSEGVIIGIGWPGQWASEFVRDDGTALAVRIGQELTHLKLRPGERIRTPLIALLFWKGDWIRAQNLWRRWMIAHNLARPGGELPPAPEFAAASSYQFGEMIHANEQNQKLFIDRYLEEGFDLDYWWMDAGWYVNESGWPNTGTWEVDEERFPGGLRAITDHAHERGVKCILWFEPERVTPGTWLYEEHPEWLLGADGGQKLLNLGNPEARQWLTEHVDKVLTEQGIDLYRTDFNIDPLPYWRGNDDPDRQGMTEIRYIEGLLAHFDEIARRHPDMLFDTCASGGRRNDLEMLRRAVPLHRSDYIFEPIGAQCHTYGISFWMPFYGAGTIHTDAYHIRSVMGPHFTACWDVRDRDLEYDRLRRIVSQWESVAHCFLGDYYPLTSYTLADDVWIGWQFDRPDIGEGFVEVFRRSESVYESARLPLRGLDREAQYRLVDMDSGEEQRMSGEELVQSGLRVAIVSRPGAALIRYERLEAGPD